MALPALSLGEAQHLTCPDSEVFLCLLRWGCEDDRRGKYQNIGMFCVPEMPSHFSPFPPTLQKGSLVTNVPLRPALAPCLQCGKLPTRGHQEARCVRRSPTWFLFCPGCSSRPTRLSHPAPSTRPLQPPLSVSSPLTRARSLRSWLFCDETRPFQEVLPPFHVPRLRAASHQPGEEQGGNSHGCKFSEPFALIASVPLTQAADGNRRLRVPGWTLPLLDTGAVGVDQGCPCCTLSLRLPQGDESHFVAKLLLLRQVSPSWAGPPPAWTGPSS